MGFYKNDKGAAFIVVIITMAVLLILGTTAASIASSNFIMGHAERRYLSAYYVAEAGIRHQIEHMRLRMEDLNANTANASAFFTTFNNPQHITAPPLILRNQGNDVVRADISMILPHQATGNTTAYTFDSIGSVGNVRRTLRGWVTVEWAIMQPPPAFFQWALFSRGSISISGSPTIIGDVATNALSITRSGNPDITGNILTNANITMPNIILPVLPARGNLNISNNDVVTINANGRYDNITVGGTLRFDLSAGDLHVQVSTLTMNSGRIETIGSGRLYFFINGNLALSGNDHINPGRPNHMVMFVTGNSIAISGNMVFAGGLYAPAASLSVSGSGQFTGALMVNSASISGSPDITNTPIAPNGIAQYFGPTPGYVPPERMFIVGSWEEQ